MNMKSLGGLLFLLGVGTFVLNYFNMQFKVLSWIDTWGPQVSLGIRVGLIVVGAALWFMGRKKAVPAEAAS